MKSAKEKRELTLHDLASPSVANDSMQQHLVN